MTKRKKSMIGHDPLAWITPDTNDEGEDVLETEIEGSEPHPLGIDVDAFLQGFELVKNKMPAVVKEFYKNLFKKYPDVKPMFDNVDIADQEQKLVGALGLLVENINDVEKLTSILSSLGSQHQDIGATKDHYAAVSKTLLTSLKKHAGRKWTKKIANNWDAVLNIASEVMLAAYEEKSEPVENETIAEDVEVEKIPEITSSESAPEQVEGVFYLEAVQDISGVNDLLENLKSRLDDAELTIDVSRITRIDASSLQLLYSLISIGTASGCHATLQGSSEVFDVSVKLLGMSDILKSAA